MKSPLLANEGAPRGCLSRERKQWLNNWQPGPSIQQGKLGRVQQDEGFTWQGPGALLLPL